MRLIRVGKPATKVADDVRASLTALGRGDATIGGFALVDVTPAGAEHPLEAVVITPYGIVIVAGVDLPGPAMRLEAPLHGVWKADNWPLVGTNAAVNPASRALAAADELARQLNTLTNMAIPVGLVLAVGPFVDNVVTVPLPGESVRVVHPTPTRLRDAISSLVPDDGRPCSVEQARAVTRLIDSNVPIQTDEALVREGFVAGASQGHVPVGKAAVAAPGSPPPRAFTPDERPTELMQLPLPASRPESERRAEVRVLPIGAVLLLVVGIVVAIVMAATGSSSPERESPESSKPERYAIQGVSYTEVSATAARDCVKYTYGDVQASLQKAPCAGMQLGSYRAVVDGKQAAVSVAVVEFADSAKAKRLQKVASTEGSGGAQDIATEQRKWPQQPTFDNAAYRSTADGNQVRLVRAAWIGETSTPDDKLLARIAQAAFAVPLTN